MLTVIDEAGTYDLATLDVVKSALGIAGSDEDTTLTALISRASAAIATACNRVLVEETVEESLRCDGGGVILLSRFPVSSISSVTEDGTALDTPAYEVDSASGLIERLSSGRSWCWARGRVVVRYVAGYEAVPPDLVQALIMTVSHFRSQAGRDPLLRAEQVTDIERLEWQTNVDGLPLSVQALITPHRAPTVR